MSTHTEEDPMPPEGQGVAYEGRDAQPGPVFITGIALMGLMVCGFVGATIFVNTFEDSAMARRQPVSPLYEREVPLGPRLQARPEVELERYEVVQKGFLDGYGYINQEAGRVRVPVEEAIKRVLTEGGLPRFSTDDEGRPVVRFEAPPVREAGPEVEPTTVPPGPDGSNPAEPAPDLESAGAESEAGTKVAKPSGQTSEAPEAAPSQTASTSSTAASVPGETP